MSKPVLHYFPGRGVADIARYLLAVVASNDYEERFLTEKEHMDALRADPSMLMWEQVSDVRGAVQQPVRNIIYLGN